MAVNFWHAPAAQDGEFVNDLTHTSSIQATTGVEEGGNPGNMFLGDGEYDQYRYGA